MKRYLILLIFAIGIFLPESTHAQSKKNDSKTQTGHHLTFNIKGATDTEVYLAIHYRDKLLVRDTAKASSSGKYIFRGDNRYDDGLYTLVSYAKAPYLNFIIDRNQHFEYNLDTTFDVLNFSVKNSMENSEMLAFQKKTRDAQKRSSVFVEQRKKFTELNNQDSIDYYNARLNDLNEEMSTFIKDLIERNPDFLFSKMQKAYQAITVPDPPVLADGSIDSNFQYRYYVEHYWDNVDLLDNRFLFLPVMESMFNEYFKKVIFYQESDTIIKYVDLFLSKVEKDSLMYRNFLDRLTYTFESSKLMGHDAVFVHIAKNNQLKGKATWLDESIVKKYQKRVNNLEPLLLGKQAVELVMPDTSGNKWYSSHKLPDKYVVLWFFDPTCHTCKKESASLKLLYDSLTRVGTRNFEVYGVGNDADINRWKKYVRDNQFPWINVGGHVANVDYLTVYNIHETGNPSMFILDENRNIILNKRISIENIPEFLSQHEKIQEIKRKKK